MVISTVLIASAYPLGYNGAMTPIGTKLIALALGLTALVGVSGCAAETNEVAMGPDVTVIDVRTPEEFELGHLEGAVNINVASGVFEAEIAELDPAGKYIVYCRTGNRSAQAVKIMKDAGFANLTDAGSVEEAADYTGLPVVVGAAQ